jgi:phosphoribosylanthranilate isomerase
MTRIKFCGLTRREDVMMAADLGAGAVGFIFWPKSPRAVTPEQARALVRVLPPFLAVVGLFVDQPIAEIQEVVRYVGLTAVQLHGRETPADAAAFDRHVIKAIGEPGQDVIAEAAAWPERVVLLVDAIDPRQRGGTGVRADWTAAATLARTRQVILAGGLKPENVAEAIGQVRPYAVDVSSGVELSPGIKDPAKMQAFADAVRAAERRFTGTASVPDSAPAVSDSQAVVSNSEPAVSETAALFQTKTS